MAQNIAIIAKPVGSRCNMNCSYCYYLEKGQYSAHEQQSVMEPALVEELIRQTMEANAGPVVSFTWHGGEPTLAGLDFYRQVVALERKYLPRGWQVWNNLQTNGLLLDDEWCRFLRDNHFDVGLSIDGNKMIHDKNRRDRGGEASYNRVRRAAKKLRSYGIQPDLLCTVNADTLTDPLGAYRALRDLDTGWIQFIPVVVVAEDGSVDPISVTPEGYGEFLCTVFDEWVCNDLGRLDVQLFAETSRVWAGGSAGVCTMAPTCGNVLVAEEDGSIYACDHFVDPEHRRGNLREHRLADLAGSKAQQEFGRSKRDSLTRECQNCPWLSCCSGGCPKDRFGCSEEGEAGQYYLCRGLKAFFDHANGPLHRAMEFSRQRKTPQEIMQILRAELRH